MGQNEVGSLTTYTDGLASEQTELLVGGSWVDITEHIGSETTYTPEQVVGRLRYAAPPDVGAVVGPDDSGAMFVVLGTVDGVTEFGRASGREQLRAVHERLGLELLCRRLSDPT